MSDNYVRSDRGQKIICTISLILSVVLVIGSLFQIQDIDKQTNLRYDAELRLSDGKELREELFGIHKEVGKALL